MESVQKVRSTTIGTGVLLTLLLCFPAHAFSTKCPSRLIETPSKSGFYVSGGYKASFPLFGDLDVYEGWSNVSAAHSTVRKMHTIQDTPEHPSRYTHYDDGIYTPPTYDKDYLSFSGSIGYSRGYVRFEIEGLHNEFTLHTPRNLLNVDAAEHIALVRDRVIRHDNFSYVKNKKISITSATVNACYDIRVGTEMFIPYVCAGISGNMVNILGQNQISPGYQGILGVNIAVTPKVSMFMSGHVHRLHKTHFDGIQTFHPTAQQQNPIPPAAEADISLSHVGGELGLRYSF